MDENTTLINITIDEDLRTLTIPMNGTVFGVVGDISVNRVMFVLPRYFRGFDLTQCVARVNYCNPNGDANYYEADDLAETEGKATFTWLMAPDVTSYIGDVKFSIQLYKKDETGKIIKNFNTKYSTGKVLEGYNVEQSVTPEQQETLVEKLSKEVKDNISESLKNETSEAISAEIEKKKTDALTEMNDKKTSALTEIENKKTAAVNKVNSEQVVTDVSKLKEDLTDLKENKFHWVEYNNLNINMDIAFGGTTYTNKNNYFSQGGAITQNGKVKIHHYADGKTNKAILMRKVGSDFLVEKYFTWTESTTGYEEVETPFVCDGSGTQYIAIQGLFYNSSDNTFEEWHKPDTKEYVNASKLSDGKALLQYYLSFYEPTTKEFDSPLRGKRWAILGDSRSVKEYYYTTKHYFEYISDRVGGMLLENHAISGAKVINNIYLQPNEIKDEPHIITVYGGVNDYGQSTPSVLGAITDEVNANTFYGKVKKCIETLITKFPNSTIIFITPIGQKDFGKGTSDDWSSRNDTNSLSLTIFDYQNAIKECCRLYNVPVYDDGSIGGYTPVFDEQKNIYFTDGFHQNAKGNLKIANGLQSVLEIYVK